MKSLLMVSLLVLLYVSAGFGQSLPTTLPCDQPGHGPVRVIKVGKASFHYYDEPQVVVASARFNVNGSETKAVPHDFVALLAAFYSVGERLTTPSFVRFNIAAATYQDGCKYRDKYADKTTNQLHLDVLGDGQSVFSTELNLHGARLLNPREGQICSELFEFDMPYQPFARLLEAREVVVTLGGREFPLKGEHVSALRAMKNGIGKY